MKTVRRIVRIGNSSGIVLTKKMMYLAQMPETYYLTAQIKPGKIILTHNNKPKKRIK